MKVLRSARPGRPSVRRAAGVLAALALASTVAACAPGGTSSDSSTSAQPEAVSTDLGTEPIELTLYDGAGLKAIDDKLIAAFTKKHTNVTIKTRFDPDDVQSQNAPRVLASDNPPDIARVNALADIVGNKLLTNLDAYADAYKWTSLPQGQLSMYRVSDDGVRGSGSQYTVASGFVLTGVYYNKTLAAKIGMTQPPATMDELEKDLAAAKAAGVQPILAGNQTGQVTTTVQNMLNNSLGQQKVNDWVFDAKDATVNTPEAVTAVSTVSDWATKGYFNADTNGTDGTAALGRFIKDGSLFYFSGSWDATALQDGMGDKVGFALAPVAKSGDKVLGMSDPVSNFGIPAKSTHKDAAAAFLNFLTSPEARQIVVDTGAGPSGTGDAPSTQAGTLKAQVQDGFTKLVAADGQVQFVQNATSGINEDWISQTQLLVAGKVTAKDYLAKIQSSYEEDLTK